MNKFLVTAEQAAKIVGVTSGTIRKALPEHDGKITKRTGHLTLVWDIKKILQFKKERELAGKKPRKKYAKEQNHSRYFFPDEYKPGKSNEFTICPKTGKMLPPERTYRGRVCREKGCRNPVPTGKLYCEEHTGIFEIKKKLTSTHADEYQCHA